MPPIGTLPIASDGESAQKPLTLANIGKIPRISRAVEIPSKTGGHETILKICWHLANVFSQDSGDEGRLSRAEKVHALIPCKEE